jgi:ABC-type sugar transport system permease subunit
MTMTIANAAGRVAQRAVALLPFYLKIVAWAAVLSIIVVEGSVVWWMVFGWDTPSYRVLKDIWIAALLMYSVVCSPRIMKFILGAIRTISPDLMPASDNDIAERTKKSEGSAKRKSDK